MFKNLSDLFNSLGERITLSEAKECLEAATKERDAYYKKVVAGDIPYDESEVFYLEHEVGLYEEVVRDIRVFL